MVFANDIRDPPETELENIEGYVILNAEKVDRAYELTTLKFDTHPSLFVGATPEEAIVWRDASILPSCALANY